MCFFGGRSEERRVGKECRSRWARSHLKTNVRDEVCVRRRQREQREDRLWAARRLGGGRGGGQGEKRHARRGRKGEGVGGMGGVEENGKEGGCDKGEGVGRGGRVNGVGGGGNVPDLGDCGANENSRKIRSEEHTSELQSQ